MTKTVLGVVTFAVIAVGVVAVLIPKGQAPGPATGDKCVATISDWAKDSKITCKMQSITLDGKPTSGWLCNEAYAPDQACLTAVAQKADVGTQIVFSTSDGSVWSAMVAP